MPEKIFLKVEKGKLLPLNDKEKSLFSDVKEANTDSTHNVSYNEKEDPLIICFQKGEDGELEVFLWAGRFSIGFKHHELTNILDLLKDKQNLMDRLVAETV